jgi:hypothetical protein
MKEHELKAQTHKYIIVNDISHSCFVLEFHNIKDENPKTLIENKLCKHENLETLLTLNQVLITNNNNNNNNNNNFTINT